jgi:uncharacterized coiled-coil protein SlyX
MSPAVQLAVTAVVGLLAALIGALGALNTKRFELQRAKDVRRADDASAVQVAEIDALSHLISQQAARLDRYDGRITQLEAELDDCRKAHADAVAVAAKTNEALHLETISRTLFEKRLAELQIDYARLEQKMQELKENSVGVKMVEKGLKLTDTGDAP